MKELKDVLQKIVIDDCKLNIPNSVSSYQQIIAESKNAYNSQKNDEFSEEQNNNASKIDLSRKPDCMKPSENQIILDEKSQNFSSDGVKVEMKLNESENVVRHISSKRKPKSHIPISTVSAAMNVAVEMRQCTGLQTEKPIFNGVYNTEEHNTFDQDNNRNSNLPLYTEDDSQQDSWASYKKRY